MGRLILTHIQTALYPRTDKMLLPSYLKMLHAALLAACCAIFYKAELKGYI